VKSVHRRALAAALAAAAALSCASVCSVGDGRNAASRCRSSDCSTVLAVMPCSKG